jgi:hypothetical protein
MKSRNINSKHFERVPEGYVGYTSKLRPSLFYGNPKFEGTIWLQDFETNKMSHWELTSDEKIDGVRTWVYEPTKKTLKKHPEVEGLTLTVYFDMVQDTKFARKKRAM